MKTTTTPKHQDMKSNTPSQPTAPTIPNSRPRLTPAQRALEKKLPLPFHQTANGGYSDIFSNGKEIGAFSRRINTDCKGLTFTFDGEDGLPLLDGLLDEAERQTRESQMPGVLELATPGGRTLRFEITPPPAIEVLSPPPANA